MRPLKMALIVAGIFFATSAIYVLSSDWMAFRMVGSKQELNALQSLKGLAYITVVAAGLFGAIYYLLKRISSQVEDIQRKKDLLLDQERKVLVGTLAASLVHDINNLLGAIKPNIRYALDTGNLSGEPREALEDAQLATQELIEMAERLRAVSKRHQEDSKVDVDVGDFVAKTVEMLAPHAVLRNCTLECNCESGARLPIYPSLLRHALINLLLNASEATDQSGYIRISLESSAEAVELTVEDDGRGIAKEERAAAREPFTTSKAEGIGLGLFSVAYCTRKHGGTFEIDDSELGGGKMRLVLPFDDPSGFARPNRAEFAS